MSRKSLENIGKEVLRNVVSQTGHTVTNLANLCGVTRSGFNAWLSNGKLPMEQLEKIMVYAAFNGAEIVDNPKPISFGDKTFIPDFSVKPKNLDHFITVEVKKRKPDLFEIQHLQAVKVDAIVYLERDQVKVEFFDGNLALKELEHQFETEHGEGTFSNPEPSNAPLTVAPSGTPYARHSYLLRPNSGETISISLPTDLTSKEAERLCLYIKSHVVTDEGSSIKKRNKTERRQKQTKRK